MKAHLPALSHKDQMLKANDSTINSETILYQLINY